MITSGWDKLAERFHTGVPPSGKIFPMESATMGWWHYRSMLTIGVSPEGLYLAKQILKYLKWHAVLIPWDQIRVEVKALTFRKVIRVSFIDSEIPDIDFIYFDELVSAIQQNSSFLKQEKPNLPSVRPSRVILHICMAISLVCMVAGLLMGIIALAAILYGFYQKS